MSLQSRRALLKQFAPQYREASSAQKRVLLDAFAQATGYHRGTGRWLLNHAEDVLHAPAYTCPSHYGPEVQHALFLVWNAANRICAKRLISFLPTLIVALERHEHLHISDEFQRQLLSMNAATADRLLSSQRKLGQRGLSTTKAGTLLKRQIPIRTFEEWNETQPGFLEADFVHAGTPVSENDQCFVEQKNGEIVRQVVGYDRLVGEHAYRQPTELYRALRLYVNCVLPSMKLQSKQREGKKVRCVYGPANTSLKRWLLSGVLPVQKQQELTKVAQALDPIRLFQQLEQLQQAVFRCATSCSPFVSNTPSAPIRVFSVERCTAGTHPVEESVPDPASMLTTLYREQERRKRILGWRRSHKDPFAGEWEQFMSWLIANPERSGGDIFRELQRLSPGRYQPLQIRAHPARKHLRRSHKKK